MGILRFLVIIVKKKQKGEFRVHFTSSNASLLLFQYV